MRSKFPLLICRYVAASVNSRIAESTKESVPPFITIGVLVKEKYTELAPVTEPTEPTVTVKSELVNVTSAEFRALIPPPWMEMVELEKEVILEDSKTAVPLLIVNRTEANDESQLSVKITEPVLTVTVLEKNVGTTEPWKNTFPPPTENVEEDTVGWPVPTKTTLPPVTDKVLELWNKASTVSWKLTLPFCTTNCELVNVGSASSLKFTVPVDTWNKLFKNEVSLFWLKSTIPELTKRVLSEILPTTFCENCTFPITVNVVAEHKEIEAALVPLNETAPVTSTVLEHNDKSTLLEVVKEPAISTFPFVTLMEASERISKFPPATEISMPFKFQTMEPSICKRPELTAKSLPETQVSLD